MRFQEAAQQIQLWVDPSRLTSQKERPTPSLRKATLPTIPTVHLLPLPNPETRHN